MKLSERVNSPTPKFFKKVRNTGLILAALGGSILASPVPLPAIVIKIAGYLAVAGTVAGTVSQTAGEIPQQAGYYVDQGTSQVRRFIDENPLGAGVIAVAAGAAIGMLLPATQIEQQTIGQARDQLVEQAESTVHQALDKVEEQAQPA